MSHPEIYPERAHVAVPCGCALGEGVLWDHRSGTLFWVDIRQPTLFAWQPSAEVEPTQYPMPEAVAFAILTPDPAIVLVGLKSGIARFDRRDGSLAMVVRPEPNAPGNRLNDACAAPDGSLYLGTMDDAEEQPTGGFHHWSRAGGLQPFGGTDVVTNGPALDPIRRVLYATLTQKGEIHRHSLAPDGRPGPSELFVRFEPGWGHPDGMTVDAEGHLWVCHFGGARVTRFDPEGRPVLVISMPTAQITKVAFGGPDLTDLYVTSAGGKRDREIDPMAGDLFVLKTGIRGLPAAICTMGEA